MAERSLAEARIEAIKRLESLKVPAYVIENFKEGTLLVSEGIELCRQLSNLEKRMIAKFEFKHEAMVYHVIHQYSNIGELYNILYVSYEDDEWEIDREDLAEGHAMAYVINETKPDCSEFGSIGLNVTGGTMVRTW